MKEFFLVLLLAAPAVCQISHVAADCTGTSSCTTTGNAIGDLEIAYAGVNATATAPSLATGWTSLGTSTINGTSTADSAIRMACKVTTGTNEASNAFTSATSLIIQVYRGFRSGTTATCASTILGTPVFTASTVNTTTATETFGAVTNGDGASWDVGFGYAPAATAGIGTAPAGMTNRNSSGSIMGGHDTNATASSFSSASVTLTTAGRIITGVVEIKAAQVATPTVDTNGGTFGTSASTTLSDSTAGSTICYTTDGSTPAAATLGTCSTGSTYSSALTITAAGTVIKALGTKSGLSNSAVATSSAFTINVFLRNLAAMGVSGAPPPLVPAWVKDCTPGSNSGVSTITCGFTGNVTSGDLIACGGQWNDATATFTSFTLSSGTATIGGFTQPNTAVTSGTAHAQQGWTQVTGTGTATISLNLSGIASSSVALMCMDASGTAASSPLDTSALVNQSSPGTGTDGVTTGASPTTTTQKDFIFAWTWDIGNNAVAANAGTGYTIRTGVNSARITESQVQSAAGSIAGTFTASGGGGADTWQNGMMAFKPGP